MTQRQSKHCDQAYSSAQGPVRTTPPSKFQLTAFNPQLPAATTQSPKAKRLLNPVLSSLQNTSSRQTDNLPTHTYQLIVHSSESNRSYRTYIMFFLQIQHVLVFIKNFKIKSKKSFHIYSASQVKLWYHTQSMPISIYRLSSWNSCTNYSFQKNGRLETENISDSHL